jgi:hypothetical protein
MKCELHSGFKNTFGDQDYDNCPHNVKFIVSYISGVTGKLETKRVCGVHKLSIEKICKRIDGRLNENYSQFTAKQYGKHD